MNLDHGKLTPLLFFLAVCAIGCQGEQVEFAGKAPRPVTTLRLKTDSPQISNQITGSVESWKTEQIGFEVGGKLDWVLEPGKNIEPRVRDDKGILLSEGTPLARIDQTQFDVGVKTAMAAVEVAERNLQVAEIRFTDTIPEDIRAAESDVTLAKTELDRVIRLADKNAVSKSELDEAQNRYRTQRARLTNLESTKKQADAEVSAAIARVQSAKLDLDNAKRDLEHTTLFASFGGQVESVDVVPGSIVSQGSPIMKLQMMNPIKIAIEVSAEQSRELQRNRQVGISFLLPDGTTRRDRAILYNINPSADASTRTFTATFLIVNEQARPALPPSIAELKPARTEQLWPLNISELVNGASGAFMIEEGAIETDGTDSWVWMVKDVNLGDALPQVLKVEKKKVLVGEIRLPFLGNWVFQQVNFEDQNISLERILVGPMEFEDVSRDDWDGESVFLDSGNQWILRPGDLVTVNLNADSSKLGFYVPVDAIYEDRGTTYVFVVSDGQVRKVEVRVILPGKMETGSLIRIESTSETLREGLEIVLGGVHFLNDGDKVRVVESNRNGGE